MTKKKKVAIAAITVILFLKVLMVYIPTSATVIFDDYQGTAFEEPLTREETIAVKKILMGKIRWPEMIYGIPACGFSRSYAIEIDGVRYMLAWDSCGVLCAESSQASKSYINISDSERDIMEVFFASRMPG